MYLLLIDIIYESTIYNLLSIDYFSIISIYLPSFSTDRSSQRRAISPGGLGTISFLLIILKIELKKKHKISFTQHTSLVPRACGCNSLLLHVYIHINSYIILILTHINVHIIHVYTHAHIYIISCLHLIQHIHYTCLHTYQHTYYTCLYTHQNIHSTVCIHINLYILFVFSDP